MLTRKEQLFNAKKPVSDNAVIPATVRFRHDKKKGTLHPLASHEKMLCALRKALTAMSDKHPDGCRFYIANNRVEITKAPTTTEGKLGGAQSYHAQGACRLGVCHLDGAMTSVNVTFSISYRDTKDSRGLPDVEFFDPTSIDLVPRA